MYFFFKVKLILDQKGTIGMIIENYTEVKIDEDLWQFMQMFTTSFQPIFDATIKLQRESLTFGDFFKIWKECELLLNDLIRFPMN